MNPNTRTRDVMSARASDWRVGRVVYQIFVDRFAPSRRLDQKREAYAPPRRLLGWDALPEKGHFLPEERIHEAETQFWGGDLDAVQGRLDYLKELGVDVVYLNPIFQAFSNHKYDAIDFFAIDPQYGSMEDLRALTAALHASGMRLILDGVFNHMGSRSHWFQTARQEAASAERDFFTFDENARNGYLGWRNVANLPELRLESAELRRRLIEGPDSAVQWYIRDVGIDGWRLDVAPDVGFEYLRTITESARAAKSDAVVIGECWNYPEEWLGVMDGVLNMHARTLILELVQRRISPHFAGRSFERMVLDGGMDGILKSHLVLDNHDTPRLTTLVPDPAARRLARLLQFTLPGCPVIYYGSELAMPGGADPTNRAPMRWDLCNDANEELQLVKNLVAIRRANPALVHGDYRALESERLFAFLRVTEKPRETLLILMNTAPHPVHDIIPIRDSRLMDAAQMECLLSGEHVTLHCGFIELTLPGNSFRLFRTVDRGDKPGYTMFKRV
jgi:cyclomaltodextrinase